MPVSKHYTLLVSKQCGFFVCFSFVCLFCLLYVWCKGNLCWRTVRVTPIFFKIFFINTMGLLNRKKSVYFLMQFSIIPVVDLTLKQSKAVRSIN